MLIKEGKLELEKRGRLWLLSGEHGELLLELPFPDAPAVARCEHAINRRLQRVAGRGGRRCLHGAKFDRNTEGGTRQETENEQADRTPNCRRQDGSTAWREYDKRPKAGLRRHFAESDVQ